MRFGKPERSGQMGGRLKKTPNNAYLAFKISQGQKLNLANRISNELAQHEVSQDWTVHYRLLPDGSMPGWVRSLKRAVRNSSEGAMHAIQNRIDLQLALKGLADEAQAMLKGMADVSFEDTLVQALGRIAAQEGADGPAAHLLKNYTFNSRRVRLTGSEDPNLIPREFRGSASPVHQLMRDDIMPYGMVTQRPNGEIGLAMSTIYGYQSAADADGDQGDVLFARHVNSPEGYALPFKDPGHRRMGIMKLVDLDPIGYLKQSQMGLLHYTPEHYGDLIASIQHQSGSQVSKLIDTLQAKRAMLQSIGTDGFGAFAERQFDVGGKMVSGQDLYDDEVQMLTKQIKGQDGAGLIHNKVVSREIYRAMKELNHQGVELTIEDLDAYLSGALAKGDERFTILEKNTLKQVKKSGVAAVEDNIEDFRYMMKESVRFFVQKRKDITNLSTNEFLDILAEIAGDTGIAGLAKMDPNVSSELIRRQVYSLGSALQGGMDSFRLGGAMRSGRSRIGSNPVAEAAGEGVFEQLRKVGFLDLSNIATARAPEGLESVGGMMAIFERPDLGFTNEINSPLGGTQTNEGVLHTLVTRPTVVADADKKIFQTMQGEEALRRYVNANLKADLSVSYRGKRVSYQLGDTTEVFSRSNLQDVSFTDRIATNFVESEMDLRYTKLSPNASYSQRMSAMRNYIVSTAKHADDQFFARFATQAQLLTKEGKNFQKQFRTVIQNFGEFALETDVVMNGQMAAFRNYEIQTVERDRFTITLASHTTDPQEMAEAIMYARANGLKIASAASEHNANRSIVVESGNELGLPKRARADIAASAKRVFAIESQVRNSVTVNNLNIAYTEIDLVSQIASMEGLTEQQVAAKYYQALDEAQNMTARQMREGVGIMYQSRQMRDKFMEEANNSPMREISANDITEEQARRLGAHKVTYNQGGVQKTVYKIPANQVDNMNQMPKVVNSEGFAKHQVSQELDRIYSDRLNNIDLLFFGGEISEKRELSDLATSLYTRGAAKAGHSVDQVIEKTKEFSDRRLAIVQRIKDGTITEAEGKRLLQEVSSEYLGTVGYTTELMTLEKGGTTQQMLAYVEQGGKASFVLNETEFFGDLGTPNKINIASEVGRKKIDVGLKAVAQMVEDIGEEKASDFLPKLREAFMAEATKTLGEDGIQAMDSIQATAILTQILEGTSPQTGRETAQAARAGQQAAAAEFVGGEIGMATAKMHQGVARKLSGLGTAGAVAGVAVGVGAILRKRREERTR